MTARLESQQGQSQEALFALHQQWANTEARLCEQLPEPACSRSLRWPPSWSRRDRPGWRRSRAMSGSSATSR